MAGVFSYKMNTVPNAKLCFPSYYLEKTVELTKVYTY